MPSPSGLLLIVDDSDPAFVFEGSWATSTGEIWYQNVSWYGRGNVTLSFNGTSVAFVGNSAGSDDYDAAPPTGLTHTISIDNGPAYNTTFPPPDSTDPTIKQSYMQWYTTPTLPSTTHTVTLSNTHLAAIDLAIITVDDPATPLSPTQRVLVDDQDPAIRYTGSWLNTTQSPFIKYQPFPGGYPINNSTHQSQAANDCFEFRFAGSLLEVYGIWYPPTSTSQITLQITLDGTTQTLAPITGPGPNQRTPNLLLFSSTDLIPGPHTFALSVLGTTQFFFLDYIVYAPSYATVGARPDLAPGYVGCAATGAPGAGVRVGLIAGVVLGLFTLGLVVILGVWRWKRRLRELARRSRQPPSRTSSTKYTPIELSEAESPRREEDLRNNTQWGAKRSPSGTGGGETEKLLPEIPSSSTMSGRDPSEDDDPMQEQLDRHPHLDVFPSSSTAASNPSELAPLRSGQGEEGEVLFAHEPLGGVKAKNVA